jgi:hypothetical protein
LATIGRRVSPRSFAVVRSSRLGSAQ